MKKCIILCLVLFAACAQTVDERTAARREITEVLDSQKESWNSRDLRGYMDHYLNSYNLTFHSGDRLIRGWENLYSMYRENYSGENMGKLDFTEVKIHMLPRDASYVTGTWKVEQPDTVRKGRFTLILRRLDGSWKIVHDHSS